MPRFYDHGKAMMFAFADFALAVVGVFVTVLVSGVPAAG